MFTLLQGFSTTFLVPNLNRIVQQVEQGTLDFVLLKPISSQFWLSARTISPWGLPDLLFGAIIIIYAGTQLGLGIRNYLISAIPILFGLIILYSLWFMLGATSIWFVRIYNVTEVLRGLLEAGRYPMVAYPAAYRFFFTFVVPVAFLTTVPAEAMLGRSQMTWVIGAGILAVGLLLASKFFLAVCLAFLYQCFELEEVQRINNQNNLLFALFSLEAIAELKKIGGQILPTLQSFARG